MNLTRVQLLLLLAAYELPNAKPGEKEHTGAWEALQRYPWYNDTIKSLDQLGLLDRDENLYPSTSVLGEEIAEAILDLDIEVHYEIKLN